jgi:LPS export ABC transporter protein LptC
MNVLTSPKKLRHYIFLAAFLMLLIWVWQLDFEIREPNVLVPDRNNYPLVFAAQLNRESFDENGIISGRYLFDEFYQYNDTGTKGVNLRADLYNDGEHDWQITAVKIDDVDSDIILLRENVLVKRVTDSSTVPVTLSTNVLRIDVNKEEMSSSETVLIQNGANKTEGEDFWLNMATGKMTLRFGSSLYVQTANP